RDDLRAIVCLPDDLARQRSDVQRRVDGNDRQHQRGGRERDLGFEKELHRSLALPDSYPCVGACAASYSFSLLCNVFWLIPSSYAARFFLSVEASVCRISPRSTASTVVPSGNRSDVRSAAEAAGACPKSEGKFARPIKSRVATIAARSST